MKKNRETAHSPTGLAVWLLPDQLCQAAPPPEQLATGAAIIMIEALPDGDRVKHHQLKLAHQFSAMRHFAAELRQRQLEVDYYAVDDPAPARAALARQGWAACLTDRFQQHPFHTLQVQEPSSYDTQQQLQQLARETGFELELLPSRNFLVPREEFRQWLTDNPEPLMENFYRQMRLQWKVLLEGEEPIGEKWNFDLDNRLPPSSRMYFPPLPQVIPDQITQKVIKTVKALYPTHPGDAEKLYFPVSRASALHWLEDFLENRFQHFGLYQDAMVVDNWHMYHSLLSPLINVGLLSPLEVIRAAELRFHQGEIPINSAEGFIRQILGWREYMNGVYWNRMPEYRDLNYFGYQGTIPKMLFDGRTRMDCVKHVVQQSLERGYTHHIQRLMILGNMCLLTQIHPRTAVEYFMSLYVDASEWATVPNVLGMILFADGGFLGTKPYAASASYVNRMSDYCRKCFYNPRKRVGERACPYNFLYWNFLFENEERLKGNRRMEMVYNLLERKSEGEMALVKRSSQQFLQRLQTVGTDRMVL